MINIFFGFCGWGNFKDDRGGFEVPKQRLGITATHTHTLKRRERESCERVAMPADLGRASVRYMLKPYKAHTYVEDFLNLRRNLGTEDTNF